jgi:hypothetical protein
VGLCMRRSRPNPELPVDLWAAGPAGSDCAPRRDERIRARRDSLKDAAPLEPLLCGR